MFFKLIEKLNKIKKFKYFFITPLVYAIGDASEQILITSLKIEKKKIIILYPFFLTKFLKFKICNKPLFEDININNSNKNTKLIKSFFNILFNIEFLIRRLFFILILKNLNSQNNFVFPTIGIHQIYKHNLIKKNFKEINEIDLTNANISLNDHQINICNLILSKKNIPTEKIVCLHVRDAGYKKDFNRKSYRNSNIENYSKLIKCLIERDYFVIRMGDNSSVKSNFSDKNYLDYAHSDFNSRLMDIFLISKCKFFVGTQSGILDLAYMFNKPVLTTNMCELFCSFPRKINDRGLFKKVKNKKTGQILSINDFIKLDYSKHNPEIEQKELEFIENSPEELFEAVNEFENLYISNNFDLSETQIEINHLIKNTFDKNFYNNLIQTEKIYDQLENGKIALWVKTFKGSFCQSYLNERVE